MKNIEFYTQYHQFYITDMGYNPNKEGADIWTDSAYKERLAIDNGFLSVLTASYGNIRLQINLLENPPKKKDFKDFDHVVEGSIRIESGAFQILDCPSQNIEFQAEVPNGIYRIRAYSSKLNSVIDDNGDDTYILEIWAENDFEEVKVLKAYIGNAVE